MEKALEGLVVELRHKADVEFGWAKDSRQSGALFSAGESTGRARAYQEMAAKIEELTKNRQSGQR